MGQKTDPRGFRLVINRDWDSSWYADKMFADNLLEDIKIRQFIMSKYGKQAMVGRVLIERPAKAVTVTIYSGRPGVIIGKKGEGVEKLKILLQKFSRFPLHINVEEIRKPELNAQVVANQVAQQIEKRIAFRRAMKKSLQSAMKLNAQGIKIEVSGRLNGQEIARSEWYREGTIPLHTLKENIQYATAEAHTTYGIIGIKVWINLVMQKLNEKVKTK